MKQRCLLLWAAGVLATLTLLAAPMEAIQPPGLALDPLTFRLLSLVNPLILMTLLVPLGCLQAPKVGLDAPLIGALLQGGPAGAVAHRQFKPALLVAVAAAGILLLYGWMSQQRFRGTAAETFAMPLLTRLAYGGVGEELLMRWGLMKLRLPGSAPFLLGAGLAALLFAAGHLPMLYLLLPEATSAMVLAVLLGNAVAGFLFGLLYWKQGLEAAMLAHALAHLIAWTAGLIA